MARTFVFKVSFGMRLGGEWVDEDAGPYLSFARNMRTNPCMSIMRNTTKIAVFDASDFERARTEDVRGLARRAFDVIVCR